MIGDAKETSLNIETGAGIRLFRPSGQYRFFDTYKNPSSLTGALRRGNL